MSRETGVRWKIKVKAGANEIEIIGMNSEQTKKWFDELEKKYFKVWQK